MCFVLIASGQSETWPIVLAANRDEFHARPTREADFWPDQPEILAGRDLQAGGTWLGVHRNGRFAALTNFRGPDGNPIKGRSRGLLVLDYLHYETDLESFNRQLVSSANDYEGFNLLYGTLPKLNHFSNRGNQAGELRSGVHGLSNHLLDTPWPKVVRGKNAIRSILQASENKEVDKLQENLLKLLMNKTLADDQDLPNTGIDRVLERRLSAIFIQGENYGTRCSTLVLQHHSGDIHFFEQNYSPSGRMTSRKTCVLPVNGRS